MSILDSVRGLFGGDDEQDRSGRRGTDDDGNRPDDSTETDEESDAGEHARETDGDTGDVVAELRGDAEDLVERRPGYDLDYSVASLDRLDDLVETVFGDTDLQTAEVGSTDDRTSVALTVFVTETGAYFGEVLRRTLGGEWRVTDEDGLVVELPVSDAAARVDAVGVAESCLTGDQSFAEKYVEVQQARAAVMREMNDSQDRTRDTERE